MSPEAYILALVSISRVWERVPEKDRGDVEGEGERERDSVLRDWNGILDISGAGGCSEAIVHFAEYEPLIFHRKEHASRFFSTYLGIKNLVVQIGKVNRSICSGYEQFGSLANHMTHAPNLLAKVSIIFYISSLMLYFSLSLFLFFLCQIASFFQS